MPEATIPQNLPCRNSYSPCLLRGQSAHTMHTGLSLCHTILKPKVKTCLVTVVYPRAELEAGPDGEGGTEASATGGARQKEQAGTPTEPSPPASSLPPKQDGRLWSVSSSSLSCTWPCTTANSQELPALRPGAHDWEAPKLPPSCVHPDLRHRNRAVCRTSKFTKLCC